MFAQQRMQQKMMSSREVSSNGTSSELAGDYRTQLLLPTRTLSRVDSKISMSTIRIFSLLFTVDDGKFETQIFCSEFEALQESRRGQSRCTRRYAGENADGAHSLAARFLKLSPQPPWPISRKNADAAGPERRSSVAAQHKAGQRTPEDYRIKPVLRKGYARQRGCT
jgi:hypothetical protein